MKINNLNNADIDESRAARLRRLISAAQNDDKNALLQLCEDFKPLLQSEARREMFYRSLGKDAEGIAALTFIELVLKYNGVDFENWPGLARCKVHFTLFDAMQKQGRIWENEAQIDTGSEAGIDLLDTGLADTARLDELARLLLSLELQEALRQLSAEQQQILTLLFLDDLKPKEVAGRLGCSVRNITKHRLKALDRLRQLLTN
ncbi:MAG: sigma-70 family RNA polymerase sigma factor [Phascolarctobacterium sp.]|uniref:RNA polymerase sigma factor n=1 Tax=Phascolarctobacterium sp. TaxID=2049039 RepID=UPI0025CE0FE7|nr:sigma-70 family RNA polymerase sigma factor [Phascolarctobacterium sp.]MCC8159153.1 sigma-70 family RNA polymerase sigma factor [Phascolarctobacterium sp.]